ncbi:MAG: hypothetical protein HC884_12460 [Chloroflexaceae bacterium]|nr:hypothetical protein [Chloroflexaceae bacterium]
MLEIQLNGWMLIAIVMAVGGYVGWRIGFRGFLTITVVSALGYLIFINGGQIILGYLNNLYTNIPRIVAILTGGDPPPRPPGTRSLAMRWRCPCRSAWRSISLWWCSRGFSTRALSGIAPSPT